MKYILALTLLPAIAFSQTLTIVERLMNEPASMFDVGLMRLERVASLVGETIYWAPGTGTKSRGVHSSYSPDKNKFLVHYWVVDDSATPEQMNARCKNAIDQLAVIVSKSIPRIFQHAEGPDDSVSRDEFKELREELLPMFELGCYVNGPSGSEDRRFRATFTFVDKRMTVLPLE